MASKTENFYLHKIDLTDAPPDITALNENWDVIDNALYQIGSTATKNTYKYKGSVPTVEDLPGTTAKVGDTYVIESDYVDNAFGYPVNISRVDDEWDAAGWVSVTFSDMESLYDMCDATGASNCTLYDMNGNEVGSGSVEIGEAFHIRSEHVVPELGQYYLVFDNSNVDEYYVPILTLLITAGDKATWNGTDWDYTAGSNATRDLLKRINKVNDKLTYGTTDLTAGTSELADGTLYFVYE